MVLSYKERSQKLRTVSEALGFDHPLTLLFNYLNKSRFPGICTNAECSLIQNVAPQEARPLCQLQYLYGAERHGTSRCRVGIAIFQIRLRYYNISVSTPALHRAGVFLHPNSATSFKSAAGWVRLCDFFF